jgi:cytochrome c5
MPAALSATASSAGGTAASASQAADADEAGKALVTRTCTMCHSLEVATGARLDPAGWKSTVDNMVERGAVGTPQELRLIVDYLSKHFGRNQI